MKLKYVVVLLLIVGLIMLDVEPALAGPGGAIAKGLFKTWWGKLIMAVVTIVLLPLILYIKFKEYFTVRANKKVLNQLGKRNRDFTWLTLNKSVKNAFTRVYIAWAKEDLQEVSEYMSSWYWQNQQKVYLDDWKSRNLINVPRLKSLSSIKPLYLDIADEENFEGSRIAFLITADVEDYLMHRETKKVVEGRRGYDEEEKIWIMEYNEGKWLVDDIQEGSMSLAFARTKNDIPKTVLSGI